MTSEAALGHTVKLGGHLKPVLHYLNKTNTIKIFINTTNMIMLKTTTYIFI